MVSAISPASRDPWNLAQTLKIGGASRPKKEARPKGPGNSLRVAAQYIQETPKNNGLFGIWLAEFGIKTGPVSLQNCHGRGPRIAARISSTPPNPSNRPSR